MERVSREMEVHPGLSRPGRVAADTGPNHESAGALIESAFQAWLGLRRRVRRQWLRWRGVRMGRGCWIQAVEIPRNPADIRLGDNVSLDAHVVLLSTGEHRSTPRLEIGSHSYVNRFTMFDTSESIIVGERCMIGPSCYITDHDHGTQAGLNV